MRAWRVRFRVKPFVRLQSVFVLTAGLGAVVATVLVVLHIDWRDSALAGAVCMALFLFTGAAMTYIALRALTEWVEIGEETLVHSVLGRARGLRFDAIAGLKERRAMRPWGVLPWDMSGSVVVWDADGRRIHVAGHIERLEEIADHLRSRITERSDVPCPPDRLRRVFWTAFIVLCLVALAVAIWLNAKDGWR